MSYLFTYNNRHSESRFYRDEESIHQNLFEILRFTQNDSPLYVLFLKRLLPVAIFFTLTLTACTEAQEFTEKDVEICKSTFKLSVNKNLSSKPINEVIIEIGKSFIGTDYVSHTLEIDGEEQLVINLTGFDCNTFLENVLVFSRNIKQGKTTFENFQNELIFIRYNDGEIDQYPSRLHYFTDWIYDNEKKGVVKDITKEIGGDILELDLSFMTAHPQYYKHLKEHPEFILVIKKQEEEINKREHYFIPQEKIAEIENKIKNGDLLVFTSSVKGLDVNHVGIAIRMDDGRIHILHAPIEGSPVQITDLPLAEYVMKIEKDTGIIVVRALEPSD
ncbi:MAG: DUF1460 domain-containing protein [Bacteroidetes bacterium]|nr:DUF1460 domain-containing protein [Bacteroidota bacterium]